jgi:hypothetical protein
MKKKIILALGGALVVILGIYGVSTYDKKQSQVENSREESASETEAQTDDLSGVGTLSELVGKNQNLECSIIYSPSEFDTEVAGTYFVADGKVRGDFVVVDQNIGEVLTSYISDSESVYIWSDIDGELFGVVASVESSSDLKTHEPVSADERVRYNCKEWTMVDSSIFIPPSGVLFKDIQQADMEYGTIYEEEPFPF